EQSTPAFDNSRSAVPVYGGFAGSPDLGRTRVARVCWPAVVMPYARNASPPLCCQVAVRLAFRAPSQLYPSSGSETPVRARLVAARSLARSEFRSDRLGQPR